MRQRRGHGEGSIKQRKDGRWQGSFELDPVNGKRARHYVYAKTRVECAAKLREAMDAQDHGFVHDGKTTVGEYLQIWLKSRRGELKVTTFEFYSSCIDYYLTPYIGGIKLAALRPQHVDQMLLEQEAKGLSASTRQKGRTVLRQAMEHALRRRLIRENPVLATTTPTGGIEPLKDHLSYEECQKVLATARTEQFQRFEALAVLALRLGPRRSELLALRWDDVDFTLKELTISKSLYWLPKSIGTVESSTKTRAGRRTVPLLADTEQVLLEHRGRMELDRDNAGAAWRDTGHVFATHDGGPMSPRNINRWWQALTKEALGRTVRLHAARHTAAVLMLEQGVPLEVVSAILGHASLSITMDIYGHVGMDAKRRALRSLENAPKRDADIVRLPRAVNE